MDQRETVINRGVDDDDPVRVVTSTRPTLEFVLPWAMAVVCAFLYSAISVARFERLATRSFDLGIFEQAVRHYAHLQAPIVDIEGVGANFLGDHWSPAIVAFAPFYRLFPTPVTLLVGQAVLVALAVVPITRAGMRHLGRRPGVAVGLAFGMSYGIQAAIDFDVHEVSLAVPLLAFGLEAFLARRWKVVVAWTAPLVLVKEDLGLTVAALGIVLVLVGVRRCGFALGVFGLGSFALTMTFLIPLFHTGGGNARISELALRSGTSQPLLHRILYLPVDVLTSPPRATTVLLLLVVTAFMCLRSPLIILVLPTLAWRFISTNHHFWGQSFHYDLVLMPIVFAALIDGGLRAQRARWQPWRRYARAAPALALIVGAFFSQYTAFRGLVDPDTYQSSPRSQAADRILSEIPDNATVETDYAMTAMLTSRTQVLLMGHAAPVAPDFILIDALRRFGPPPHRPVHYADAMHPGATYVLLDGGDGFTLLRRVP